VCYGAKERWRGKSSREGRDSAGRRRQRGKEERAGELYCKDAWLYGARIFKHDGGWFVKCPKMWKRYGILLEISFSLFFPKKYGWGRDMGYS
jgi:hypothetical protein